MGRIIFLGPIGSDAGGWYIGPDGKIHRVPGWNPEQMRDLHNAVTALKALGQMKTPGAERIIASVHELVTKELSATRELGGAREPGGVNAGGDILIIG